MECFKLILEFGGNINDTGIICFSPKQKNQVWSNVIGAAAVRGNLEVLRYVLSTPKIGLNIGSIDYETVEKLDKNED